MAANDVIDETKTGLAGGIRQALFYTMEHRLLFS